MRHAESTTQKEKILTGKFYLQLLQNGKIAQRGIRHERSEVCASIADRRARSAGQPHKKITLSAACRKQQRKNEKTQEQVYLQS